MTTTEDYIERCCKVIRSRNEQQADALAREIIVAFNKPIPHIASYRGSTINGHGPHTIENIKQLCGKLLIFQDDVRLIVRKLKLFRERAVREQNIAAASSTVLSQENHNTNYVSQVVEYNQALTQISNLPSSSLDDNEKTMLKGLLTELEQAKGTDKKNVEKVSKRILEWLADKGVDVLIAALPYMATALSSI